MQTPKTRPHLALVEPARTVEEIRSAVAALVMAFACDMWETTMPTPAEVEHALRQPVSMATVLCDLCQQLNVIPPQCVEHAIDDPPPF